MAEYINRDDLLKVIHSNVAEAHNERCSQLLEAILNAPTADVVEVVRCKKCKYGDVSIISKTKDGQEDIACYCKLKNAVTDVESYCPSGERKDN